MNKKLGQLLQPEMGLYFVLLVVFSLLALILGQFLLAGLEGLATVILVIVYLRQRKKRRKELLSYIQSASETLKAANQKDSPFPIVVVQLNNNCIIWTNERFAAISGFKDSILDQKLPDVIPNFHTEWLSSGKNEYAYDVTLNARRYRVTGTAMRATDREGTMLGVLYFTDLTELYQVRDEYIRSRPVVSIILIDNYEELIKGLNDGAISTLNAKINDVIVTWTDQYRGLLRKLERNRYMFLFEKRDLAAATEDKFSLLEQIHQVTSPSGLPASISFGLGVDGAHYDESFKFAALAVEMALSRGGDQAVIKDRVNFSFFGGHAREADHRSKVRSRVTANSLMELIGQSSQVFVMGHKNADMDAIGAAMGVCCMCRKKGKRARIVVDMEVNASKQLIEEIQTVPEYADVFISEEDALLHSDSNSILVVVDTNRPDQVEYRSLLESMPKICVIDHHRRASDYINPVVVNFHEPSASSASELVAELLQYTTEKSDVLPIEAKSLMAGLFLDTKSFNVRTGERTFEAAAFLQRMEADTVEVKKLLQNDFKDTMEKYQIIKSARLYREEIAIAALNNSTNRVLAAQAADEMLNIAGITASFVMFPQGEEVIISARSIGSANVQMILEPLGGGGNTATAGAQVKNATVRDTLDRLVASINQFYEK